MDHCQYVRGNSGKNVIAGDHTSYVRRQMRIKYALMPSVIAAILVAGVARADEVSELRAEIRALNKRLTHMEEQKKQEKVIARRGNTESATLSQSNYNNTNQVSPSITGPLLLDNAISGRPVHIVETTNTDVLLYGIIEPTFGFISNADKAGHSTVGLDTSWFSGNRWGLYVTQRLPADYDIKLIAKMESEFELPSGNMDTPGVLFNRDAWVGFESSIFGKITAGRQNTLPRDVANIWADPYGASALTTGEGGFTNKNNFKQLIFYTGGGNGAGGQGDTRYDQGLVWKKIFENGLYLGAAYSFSDGNGPNGPNGSGPIPGAGLDRGTTEAVAVGYNADPFHVSAFYNRSNVLEIDSIGVDNIGHIHQSWGIGGNWDSGLWRLNAGYLHYSAYQGVVGTRTDDAVTVSAKFAPSVLYDFELGWQDMFAHNAALTAAGYTFVPFRDASSAVLSGSGSRMTVYGSAIYHPMSNIDIYLAGDYLVTTGSYRAAEAHGHRTAEELVTGVRYKW